MSVQTNAAEVRGQLAPVYDKYPSQTSAQPAFLEIDPRANGGQMIARSNSEIGNGVPMEVWNKQTLRVSIPNDVSGEALADFMERGDVQTLVSTIIEGHSVKWDGCNNVGHLGTEADAALKKLEAVTNELNSEYYRTKIWNAAEWIAGDLRFSDITPVASLQALGAEIFSGHTDADLEALANKLEEEAKIEFVVLEGGYNALADVRDNCRNKRLALAGVLAEKLTKQAQALGLDIGNENIENTLEGVPLINGRYEGFLKLHDKETGLAIMDVGRGNGAAFLAEKVDVPLEVGKMYKFQFQAGRGVHTPMREPSKSRGMEF